MTPKPDYISPYLRRPLRTISEAWADSEPTRRAYEMAVKRNQENEK